MRSTRTSPVRVTEARASPEDVLIDLGAALVDFGNAVQLAGRRLHANQRQASSYPEPLAPAPIPSVAAGLPAEGFVRIWDILGRKAAKGRPSVLGVIPVSRTTWYAGVKAGRFPQPLKHGGTAMWRVDEIQALIARLRREQASSDPRDA